MTNTKLPSALPLNLLGRRPDIVAARWEVEGISNDFFFFSSRRRHTRSKRDWSSDVCSSDLRLGERAEALDELALDPHHPPRVTVHPVGLVATGQQALVAGRPGHLAAAQQDRALAVPVAVRARSLLSAHGPTLGDQPGPEPREAGEQLVHRAALVVGVREGRVTRAEVHRRDKI